MPENVTPTVAVDLDQWLAGVTRPARTVVLYGRGDLQAELTRLDAQIKLMRDEPQPERAMGETSPLDDLKAQRSAIFKQITSSRMEFRVEGSLDNEVEEITASTRKVVADEIKAAQDEARTITTQSCKDLGFTAKETGEAMRRAVAAAGDTVLNLAALFEILGGRVSTMTATGEWVPVGASRLKVLRDALGDPQFSLLRTAWIDATNKTPEGLDVPFSPAP